MPWSLHWSVFWVFFFVYQWSVNRIKKRLSLFYKTTCLSTSVILNERYFHWSSLNPFCAVISDTNMFLMNKPIPSSCSTITPRKLWTLFLSFLFQWCQIIRGYLQDKLKYFSIVQPNKHYQTIEPHNIIEVIACFHAELKQQPNCLEAIVIVQILAFRM